MKISKQETGEEKAHLNPDGERMVPEYHKGELIYGEHLSRYEAILELCKNRVVLDIASGSGYGTKMISKGAKKVYGVDISEDAVNYARSHFNSRNIDYSVGSGTKIPLADNSIDVVVSMETIEHIEAQEAHLSEIVRVLKHDGVYICSTPNDRVYPKGNHFHVREHSSKSLRRLLTGYFKQASFYYQTIDYVASIFTEQELSSQFTDLRNITKCIDTKPDESIYFLVLCTNSSSELPELKSSHYISKPYSYPDEVQRLKRLGQADIDLVRIKYLEKDLEKNIHSAQEQARHRTLAEKELLRIKSSRSYKFFEYVKKLAKRTRK